MLANTLLSLALSLGISSAFPTYPRSHNISSFPAAAAASSNWWYANLDHTSGAVRDYAPGLYTNGQPDYNYQIYVACSGGDSNCLINAIASNGPNGQRDNGYLAAEPRVIYLAPGTYTLNSQLNLFTDTVIIGDASNPPTIRAASGFNGNYLILGGQDGNGNGGELKFSTMIKNVILDTTANSGNNGFTALSWRVAQNAALVNVQINMPQGAHTGIYMGQGSTIQVGDVSFQYGNTGLYYNGMQQATLKNLHFKYCTTGIYIDSGFTINIMAPRFESVGNSIILANSGEPWVSVVDGVSVNSGNFFTSNNPYPNFMIENIQKDTTNSYMVSVGGNTKIGGVTSVQTYVYGNTYGANPIYQTGSNQQSISRPSQLAPGGKYPVITAPQYPDKTINDVINLKDSSKNGGFTLHGDRNSDDTAALQGAINTAAAQGKIAYLPFGVYGVHDTITIPVGTNLVGNGWSTISGFGSNFKDENNPRPVVRVGKPGDVGVAHLQDLRFTVGEQLPGAIILQINMAGNSPGDVSLHNSLITLGGTPDTSINCGNEAQCKGAYLGLHLSSTSSAYIDNFWSWVADHPTDGSGAGTRVAGKGGILIEATKGTWLQGVGSEHWWLYNLNYHNAANVFTALFQSETNYNQASNVPQGAVPPQPFNPTSSDPNFSWCNGNTNCAMTIAQYINGGSNLFSYASGSWNFGDQQTNMNVEISRPSNSHFFGLTDHTAQYIMRLPNGSQFGNGGSDGYGGSWGTLVAQFNP